MINIRDIIKSIGPGILFAGAAIGASHIVQSTRAGATFGFSLLGFVIIANLLKYPFFEYGQRYTAATGETILEGYGRMGRWEVWIFYVLNHITSVISIAGVTFVTAALSSYVVKQIFGLDLSIPHLSALILLTTIILLVYSKYDLLDRVVKILILTLSLATVLAFFISLDRFDIVLDTQSPEIWDETGFMFLIALMGWMPAPIEASTWASVWMIERKKQTGFVPNMRQALLDFNVGYIGTAILAMFFLGLGSLSLFGTGVEISGSAIGFTTQLISMYTESLGNWSAVGAWIISIVALATMASTTMTVVDAYPRTLAISRNILFKDDKNTETNSSYISYLIGLSAVALIIIYQFTSGIKSMIDFVTTVSFLAAPFFAIINYKLILSKHTPDVAKPNKFMHILSITGIVFLLGFSVLFIIFRFL
jgi:Mn2+/Fe2+ NRAMP family transporter